MWGNIFLVGAIKMFVAKHTWKKTTFFILSSGGLGYEIHIVGVMLKCSIRIFYTVNDTGRDKKLQ